MRIRMLVCRTGGWVFCQRRVVSASILVMMLFISSCKKVDDPEEGTVRLNENGTPMVDCRTWDDDDDYSECTPYLCLMEMQYQICEESLDYCHNMEQCFADFYYCFEARCHPGDALDPDQRDYYALCEDDYWFCVDEADTDPPVDTDTTSIPYTGPDPYAELDCAVAGLDETLCDGLFCAERATFDTYFYGCNATPDICERVWQCARDNLHCRMAACPPGTPVAEQETTITEACLLTYTDCLQY